MATIHVGPLQDHLEIEQISSILAVLEDADFNSPGCLGEGNQARSLDDMTDLMDQLEANDAAAEVYLPIEFEEILECNGMRIGSSHNLLLVLDEIASDLFPGDGEDEEDEISDLDDDGFDADQAFAGPEPDLKEEQMRSQWELLREAARMSAAEDLAVFVDP